MILMMISLWCVRVWNNYIDIGIEIEINIDIHIDDDIDDDIFVVCESVE